MAGKRERRSEKVARRRPPEAGRARRVGEWLVAVAVVLGVAGVPLAVWPGLADPFGAPKALALALAATLVLAGLALDAGSVRSLLAVARASRIAWALLALLGLAALATAASVSLEQSLAGAFPGYRGLVATACYAAIALGVASVWLRSASLQLPGRALSAAALGVAAVAAWQRATLAPAPGGLVRVASTLGNPSNLGVWSVVAIWLAVDRLRADGSRIWRAVAGVALIGLALCIFWSASRGAWLAALVSAAGFFALELTRRAGRRPSRGLLIGALVALAAVVLGALLTPRFLTRVTSATLGGGTEGFRLSAWASAAEMTVRRPLLGYGPSTFKLAYAPFMAAGQIDGKNGYQFVEAAHNIFLDTSTSFGVAALVALVAAAVLAATALWRARERPVVSAAAPALLGGLVALQFHYVTLDTGPLLVSLLAVTAALEAAGRSVATESHPRVLAGARAALGASAALALVACFAAAGLVASDAALARANALVAAGAQWPDVAAAFGRARSLAPWEPEIPAEEGQAAIRVLGARADDAALAGGLAAFDRALRVTPTDPVLLTARSELLLAAAIRSGRSELASAALPGFRAAERLNPGAGMPYTGEGSALVLLGKWDGAKTALEKSISRSPFYRPMWVALIPVYRHFHDSYHLARAIRRAAGH